MKFTELALPGVWLIEPEPITDERGFFARTFCRNELAEHGLQVEIAQTNLSFNLRRGTLRGLHYQLEPHGEDKLVSCVEGALFDVVVDVRAGSPTRGTWIEVELSADGREILYIPKGFAHGFQTLVDGTLVSYLMSTPYVAEAARGVRYDALPIPWPVEEKILSPRDAAFPGL